MLGYPVTLFAKDAIGIEMVLKPFQAGRVIGKQAVKVSDSEFLGRRLILLRHG